MAHNKYEDNLLMDYYGSLLTERQTEILTDYLIEDLSMQEIAENNNISKSAVSDIIKRSIAQLKEYENKLHFIKQSKKIDLLIEKMKNDNSIDKKYIKELIDINRG